MKCRRRLMMQEVIVGVVNSQGICRRVNRIHVAGVAVYQDPVLVIARYRIISSNSFRRHDGAIRRIRTRLEEFQVRDEKT